MFLFENFLSRNIILNQKTGTVKGRRSVGDRPVKGQSLERRCSSRTFRYGYLVTT